MAVHNYGAIPMSSIQLISKGYILFEEIMWADQGFRAIRKTFHISVINIR